MTFDPYHKWLGIPPAEQPADHYRLLAITRFEGDPDVIEGAADRQMAHVRTFQAGQHSAESQRILNELASAKLCLLNAAKKVAYDSELRRKIDATRQPQPAVPFSRPLQAAPVLPVAAVAPAAAAPAPVVIVADDAVRPHAPHKRRPGSGRSASAWIALAAVAVPTVVFVGYLIYNRPEPEVQRKTASLTRPNEPPMRKPAETGPKPKPLDVEPPSPRPEKTPQLDKTPELSNGAKSTPPRMNPPQVARTDAASDGFISLFNGRDLTGWKTHPSRQGLWRVEDGVLIGSGPAASNLFSERGNYTNFHLRAEASINDGGNSGVFCRSTFDPTLSIGGYEAQINNSHADKNKTGSLYGPGGAIVTILNSPAPPNTWFTLELVAVDNHITVKVNGQTTADYSDADRRFAMGHIALQQHDPQTIVKFRKIEISESPVGASPTMPDKPAKPPDSLPPRPSLADTRSDNHVAKLTATEAFSLRQHTAAVTRVAFHRTLPLLASAGKDGQVLLWNLETRAVQTVMHKFQEEVWAIKFSPDGQSLAFANRNWWGSRLFFKTLAGIQIGQPIKDFKNPGGAVAIIAYSPDGRLFAVGQDDGTIRLWDIAHLKEITPVSFGVGHNIYGLAFGSISVDQKRRRTEYLLAAASQDGTVKTLAATLTLSKKELKWNFVPTAVQFPKSGPVIGVRFSSDGKLLGYTRLGGVVCLCDPRTGQEVRVLAQFVRGAGSAEWIAFHPHRPWCVTAHKEAQVARIWNTDTAELLCELKGHASGVMCAEFSPDGRQVATASDDFSIKLWDLAGPEVPAAVPRAKKPKPVALVVGE